MAWEMSDKGSFPQSTSQQTTRGVRNCTEVNSSQRLFQSSSPQLLPALLFCVAWPGRRLAERPRRLEFEGIGPNVRGPTHENRHTRGHCLSPSGKGGYATVKPSFGVFSGICIVVRLFVVGLQWSLGGQSLNLWLLCFEAATGQSPHGLGADGFQASIIGLGCFPLEFQGFIHRL